MSYCKWGAIQGTKQIFRGVRSVSCAGHGGVIVTQSAMEKSPKLEKLRTYPEINKFFDGKVYNFEEDCDYALVFALLDITTLSDYYNRKLAQAEFDDLQKDFYWSLISYNPDFYTHLTGKDLQVFDSYMLMKDLIENNENEFFTHVATQSNCWDIPDGKKMFSFKENKTNRTVTCLGTKEQYDQLLKSSAYLRVYSDLSDYEPFTPNKRLPHSKAKNPNPDTYYFCTRDDLSGGNSIIEAYNYQTNSFKQFEMKTEYWTKERVYEFEFKDDTHSELIGDLALFVQEAKSVTVNAA